MALNFMRSPGLHSIIVHQMNASTKAQMPMKTSMKILMVVAAMVTQPS